MKKTIQDISLTSRDKALLRRGVSPWEVAGFYDLLKQFPDYSPNQLAIAAPVVALVRENDDTSLGLAMSQARLNERRLRRLLASRDRKDLAHQLESVIRILQRKANKQELIETIVFWGERRRRDLARDYFTKEQGDDD